MIYNIGITVVDFGLKCVAPFNNKIKLGVKGRAKTFDILKSKLNKSDKTLWFHCASLGEYEQGLPVFQDLKKLYKNHKIVLSFFSPSGYEIKKDSSIADIVVYLPLDSKTNASNFIDIIRPELTVFVKYEIWPNYLSTLKQGNYKTILISALFRETQTFFRFYGKKLKKALFAFDHIFTQDQQSKDLLKSIGFNSVTVSGDTRFDRVLNQLDQDNLLPFIEAFKQDSLCFVAGSIWPEDEEILVEYINTQSSKKLKFILVPHDIKTPYIEKLQQKIKLNSVLYSKKENKNLKDFQVLIIDTVGYLSRIYKYADIAYVGGGMGTKGLHNTLEAAVFGIPIIIGKNYSKHPEAISMIDHGGMFSVSKLQEFEKIMELLIQDYTERLKIGQQNFNFIKKNRGAVIQIMEYSRKLM
ncbi:glycosyltransferase N-terminal domain-containing protein [Yeosuana sp. MJ-SS3]|uniref:3-deoxy-D-manno-octulosonic acid transferase n=1 Tax=Gilvirhabdus luticola TaxID=3079858 RepID=A0ABU3U646_9FLAO|nr:glycosyltransferase N-terminal domain-containing protein [Yeosuana sp. MJ-SS3]MDU8885873.1 glycosyltransferase N-terminal domain-containing protein [Yeosuana sp. MJ-SS3]